MPIKENGSKTTIKSITRGRVFGPAIAAVLDYRRIEYRTETRGSGWTYQIWATKKLDTNDDTRRSDGVKARSSSYQIGPTKTNVSADWFNRSREYVGTCQSVLLLTDGKKNPLLRLFSSQDLRTEMPSSSRTMVRDWLIDNSSLVLWESITSTRWRKWSLFAVVVCIGSIADSTLYVIVVVVFFHVKKHSFSILRCSYSIYCYSGVASVDI